MAPSSSVPSSSPASSSTMMPGAARRGSGDRARPPRVPPSSRSSRGTTRPSGSAGGAERWRPGPPGEGCGAPPRATSGSPSHGPSVRPVPRPRPLEAVQDGGQRGQRRRPAVDLHRLEHRRRQVLVRVDEARDDRPPREVLDLVPGSTRGEDVSLSEPTRAIRPPRTSTARQVRSSASRLWMRPLTRARPPTAWPWRPGAAMSTGSFIASVPEEPPNRGSTHPTNPPVRAALPPRSPGPRSRARLQDLRRTARR